MLRKAESIALTTTKVVREKTTSCTATACHLAKGEANMARQRRSFVIVFLLALVFAAFITPMLAEEKVGQHIHILIAHRKKEEIK